MAKSILRPKERFRVLDYFVTQPAVFCFVLSLFLIAITLSALGVYVRGREHMPDLDAMKVITVLLKL